MNIFLSYPSARRGFAEALKLALEAEQHEVFFDRDDLPAGESFHQAIRAAVQAADLFIFVVAPESLREGGYARAELALAQEHWPQPGGHVLPVLLAPVDMAQLPPYLLAVTLLEPRGDAVAATLAAVVRLNRPAARRWALKAAVGVAVLVALAASWWVQQQRQHAAAELVRRVGEALAVAKLCTEGDPAVPFAQLSELAGAADAPAAVKQAQEDCAMHWLRLARPGPDRTFAQYTAPLKPVLVRALAVGPQGAGAVNGPRAADLRAHLGWADAMRWQDLHDPGIDPTGLYREALQQDPGNAYAHGMWANWLLIKSPMQVDEALKHFEAAVAAKRDLPFIRRLQLGAMLGTDALGPPLVQLLSQMRQNQEPLSDRARQRAWSYHYAHAWREGVSVNVLKALPAVEGLATFDWLFPAPATSDSRHATWVLLRAQLQLQLGLTDAARAALQAVLRQMRAEKDSGPIVDAVNRQLSRLP
jgi:hypothetical protein